MAAGQTKTCAHCGYVAGVDFAFCPKCGNAFERSCPSCGTKSPSDFTFCPKCGTSLAQLAAVTAPSNGEGAAKRTVAVEPKAASSAAAVAAAAADVAPEGERRLVTVMFTDISGFTSMSESMDPEEVRDLVDDILRGMATVVDRYGGTVDKYTGDGLMANFGAPILHEDDPERAIRAAIEIQDGLRASRPDGSPLGVHIGINTGLVVAGSMGAAEVKSEYTVVGDAVNVAARLLSAAGASEILVGESTYRRAAGAFDFGPLRQVVAKGKAEAVAAYQVLGVKSARTSTRGLAGMRDLLVGRDEELRQLRDAFDRAARGRLQVIAIVGEAGIGKSKLVQAFLTRVREEPGLEFDAYSASCPALAPAAYQVPRDLLRQVFYPTDGQADVQLEAGMAQRLAELDLSGDVLEPWVKRLISDDVSPGASEEQAPELLKQQLFYTVTAVCERLCRRRPVVMVADDLHWADAASLEVIKYVIDRLHDRPMLWLVMARPGLDTAQLFSVRASCAAIRLANLNIDDSLEILAGMFGPASESFDEQRRRTLVEKAGGNPYFLEEIVRSLIVAGLLVNEDGRWQRTGEIAGRAIPDTLQGIVMARIDRLSTPAKRLLQVASVIGAEFDRKLLAAVAAGEPSAAGVFDELREAELVSESLTLDPLEATYGFSHTVIHEVAYGSLLKKRRRELHRLVADCLEQRHAASLAEHVLTLAEHYDRADVQDKAVFYLDQAGARTMQEYAFTDAAQYYERALQRIATEGEGSTRARVFEGYGDAMYALGQYESAIDLWSSALELRLQEGAPACAAELHRKLGTAKNAMGARALAREHYLTGLKALDGAEKSVELARLYQELGRWSFRGGDNQAASDWALKALELGETLEASEVISQACNTLGAALARSGETERAIAFAERSLDTALEHKLLNAACRAYANLGTLYAPISRQKSIEFAEKGLQLAQKIGDVVHQSWLYAALGGAYCSFTGDCTQGLEAAQRSVELDRRLSQLDHLAVPLIILGQIHQCHGELEKSEGYFLEAVALAERMNDPQLLFPCYDGLAMLHLNRGDEEKAAELLDKAQMVSEAAGYHAGSMLVLPFLC